MFASVLERNLPPRQIGSGAALALGIHAVVIAAAVVLSARPTPLLENENLPSLKQFTPSRFVELGSKGPSGGGPVRRASAERRAVRPVTADAERSKKRASESATSAALSETPSTAGDATGPAEGPIAHSGGGDGASSGGASSGTTIAIPFGEGMQRPTLLAHPAPVYSREANAAHASGVVIAKCVITLEGTLRQCRIVRGVAHMDAAVLEALSQWRYTPVMFQGRPVSVDYTINLRLVAP
ncbi:MAG: energy transducer TonB [Polyangiaceae bacterium]